MYLTAIRLNPGGRDAYEELAGIIYTVDRIKIEHARAIARACAKWPESGRLQLGRALVALKSGDVEPARVRINQLLAAQTLSEADASYANRVLADEEWSRQIARFDELIRQSRYGEAVAWADEITATAPNPTARLQLTRRRMEVFEYQQLAEAQETLRRGETAEARILLEELVASAETRKIRAAASELLADLELAEGAAAK